MLAQWFIPANSSCDEFVTSWDVDAINRFRGPDRQRFIDIMEEMGAQSAEAQGLRQVLTNYQKMQVAGTRLYVATQKVDGRALVVGILKMGSKNLFVRTQNSQLRELQPLCCLDFYVHYSTQRCGIGKRLFEAMLEAEQVQPHKIAYDRPSPKLIGFLAKHYNLRAFTPQENNFVVFHQYFEDLPPDTGRRSRRGRPKATTPAAPALLQASNHKPTSGRRRNTADVSESQLTDPTDLSQATHRSTTSDSYNRQAPQSKRRADVSGRKASHGITAARGRIPVMPSLCDSSPNKPARSEQRPLQVSNILSHPTDSQIKARKRQEYQTACQQRTVSWWG